MAEENKSGGTHCSPTPPPATQPVAHSQHIVGLEQPDPRETVNPQMLRESYDPQKGRDRIKKTTN
jgi:hypothetical protein